MRQNLTEIMVSADRDGSITIIDLDRAKVAAGPAPPGRARANLRRLRRSFKKLGLTVALDHWEAFELGYDYWAITEVLDPETYDPEADGEPEGLAAEYIEYVLSDEIQEGVVRDAGFTPIRIGMAYSTRRMT